VSVPGSDARDVTLRDVTNINSYKQVNDLCPLGHFKFFNTIHAMLEARLSEAATLKRLLDGERYCFIDSLSD